MRRFNDERMLGIAVVVFAAMVVIAVWFLVDREPTRVVRPRVTVTMPAKKQSTKRKAVAKRSTKKDRARPRETSGPLGAGANPGSRRDSRSTAKSPTSRRQSKSPAKPQASGSQGTGQNASPPSPQPAQTPQMVTVTTPGGNPSLCHPLIAVNC